jgi:anaerobic magnesium-protoporphyrin IX monomethyl ester cyclase
VNILFLIAEPDMASDFCQQPIEVLYTAAILRAAGHESHVVDLRVSEWDTATRAAADLVVLVTQTYDLTQCFSITLRKSADAVQAARLRWPDTPIVAAGVHASLEPAMTTRELRCDASLPGELEAAVPWLVARMTTDPEAFRHDLRQAPASVDPASLPVPDFDLIDVDAYYGEVVSPGHQSVLRARTGLVFANRGCPYSCDYCFVWFGSRIRQRRAEQVVAELTAQRNRGVRDFFFLDYTFTLQRAWVLELCDLIKQADLDISWICQTRCERVDEELLTAMRAAGCSGVFFGVESPWIAESDMHKPTPRATIDHAVEITRAANLMPFLFILVGLENKDPVRRKQLISWLSDVPAMFDASSLLPRPHTSLWSRYTANLPAPTSWEQYQQVAEQLQSTYFLPPTMRGFYESIAQLPNYVGNIPSARLVGSGTGAVA